MKVKIEKSRKVYKGNLNSGRINENKYEVLEFEFPQELENFTKYIEIEAIDNEGTLRYADRIEDNEFAIDNTLSKYSLITAQVICKDLRENVVFKSNPFEFTFEQSLNIMEDIEEEQHDLLDRIELELQEAKEDITDLQETQEQHTEQIQTNATDIEDLQERVTTNETDISNIKTKNTQQDTAIETNTQDISDIKSEQITQNTNITSNTNRIIVLEEQSGNKVALSINSNYVMTLQLLNKNNEVLSTGTIDLPIESMVVNASYSNGVLTLTLQNGQTLNVDISDIVSGLVSETTFNTAINGLQSSITALQGRMTTAETDISNKVDKITGKGLSTNDYTTEEKNKLASLENYDDTQINAEITDLQTDLEMAIDLFPTGEATGSDITVNDSAKYYFKKFEVEGKSEQDGEPTPTNEVPIQNVTGNVEVKVENKNLAKENLDEKFAITGSGQNRTVVASSYYISEIIAVKPNTNYTVSGDFSTTPDENIRIGMFDEYPTLNSITTKFTNGRSGFNFTTDTNTKYILLYNSRDLNDVVINNFFVCETEYANSYVSHEEQTVTFPLSEGQVLHEEDTIEDKIVQKRNTYEFTGTESFTKSGGYTTSTSFCCYTASIRPTPKVNGSKGLLNIGNVCNVQNIANYSNAFAYNNSNALHFLKIQKTAIPNWNESLTDSEKTALFKAYLAQQYANGTPVTLEYELATPIETEFTEAQATAKAQIDKLYSYKGTTHITSEANLNVIYRKDIETMIDNLSNAIVAQGGV